MVDLVMNNLNVDGHGYEHSAFEILQNVNQYDFLRSNSTVWDLASMNIYTDTSDSCCLKAEMKLFIKDHPTIVNEIKNYFSDELIEHILKRFLINVN